jgi:hypothetical protein
MNAIVRGAVISSAGALLLGASLALSGATVVSGATRAHPDATAKPIKCASSAKAYCLTVQNTRKGGALEGEAKSGTGVFGTSSSGIGVSGSSSSSAGVYGSSSAVNSAGVYGNAPTSSDGVYGISSSGTGVDGLSSSGAGVSGSSSGAAGVYGSSSAVDSAGVSGSSPYGYGVYGTGGVGIYGTGTGLGVVGKSAGSDADALEAYADGAYTNIFYGENSVTGGSCDMDASADLSCSGKISGARVQVQHTTSQNRHVLAYASESATPTIEDLGAARMRDGIADVEIPSDFASVIDRSNAYYVFLTAMGDTRGLYVSMQSASRFQVRENMHGRSNVEFEYRIIAVPLGAKNVRLPNAPRIKPPVMPKLLETKSPLMPRPPHPSP